MKRALARSCNTWFYQVGIDVGPSAFLSLSRRLGFGERTGLPLIGESQGLVPSDEWMMKHEKRRILDGDTANLSIGQGSLLASPLQVAQAMAGIANGGALPKLQLIRQVQDTRGRVVRAAALVSSQRPHQSCTSFLAISTRTTADGFAITAPSVACWIGHQPSSNRV